MEQQTLKTNKTLLNHFPLELWIYHTPLTWYEQENLRHKANFKAFIQSTVVFASTILSWITKTLRVGPTGRYMTSQNP